jgi:hypothetical protein
MELVTNNAGVIYVIFCLVYWGRWRRSRGMKLRIRSPGLTILLTTGWPTYLNTSTLNNQRLIFHLVASALAFRFGFTLSS